MGQMEIMLRCTGMSPLLRKFFRMNSIIRRLISARYVCICIYVLFCFVFLACVGYLHDSNSNDDVIKAWAQILTQNHINISFFTIQWHLNGLDKGAKNFGAPEGRSFGFQDTRYLWNRGHWKCLDDSNGRMKGYSFNNCVKKFTGDYKMKRVYNTDFLTDKAIEFIKAQKELNNKFALMVSYPDPHAPNKVRAPYDTMYDDTNFEFPHTAKVALKKEPAIPNWSYRDPKYRNVTASDADAQIDDIEASNDFQKTMRQNFGMIKLIDDSVGRILNSLHETGLTKNTILVFTSDHGDLMAEHGNYGKVLPYKTSAGIPFILRWPDKIKPKVVSSVFSSVDFVPTILNLVGAKSTGELDLPGIDASPDLLDAELWKSNSLQTRFIDGPNGRYAAALTERFKLVLNKKGTPWLFDLEKDPDELLNFYKSTEFYTEVSTRMQADLVDAMAKHDFGLMKGKNPVYLDRPACEETLNNLGRSLPVDTCHDLAGDEAEAENYCAKESFQTTCPVTCNSCVEDSVGTMLLKNREITCDKQVRKKPNYYCKMKYVQLFCADTCSGFMSSLSNRALAGGKEIIQEDVRHPRRRLLPF